MLRSTWEIKPMVNFALRATSLKVLPRDLRRLRIVEPKVDGSPICRLGKASEAARPVEFVRFVLISHPYKN